MANPTDPVALHRGFVAIHGAYGPREVHYRRGGQGPAVLLLHQSPQSSREMEPLIEAWGHAFTLVAPDTPGYGHSEPLQLAGGPAATATIQDFAAATLEFADVLGLGRFGIYGYHTGASIGTALAAAHPDRVTAVAANGLVVQTGAERAAILRDYLPPLVPRWDGGHLAWLWARLREQAIFFPWHDRRAATRMDFDVPTADRLHLGALEFLAAADHYHVAYRAAFEDRAEQRLPAMRVPVLVTAAARDPLAGHLTRIDARSDSVRVEPSADTAAALARSFAHLGSHPGDAAPAPATGAADAGCANAYVGSPGRQVRVIRQPERRAGTAPSGRPTAVVLHAPGGSAAALGDLAAEIATHADVLRVDLPGHGASDPPPSREHGAALAGTVAQLSEALSPAMAADRTTVLVAIGASAPVAVELAGRLGAAIGVVLVTPPAWSAADSADWLTAGLPALTPAWHGGHLLEAWHMVRDGRLFTPWFRRNGASIRPGEPDLDDRRIQRDVLDLLRANGTWQALLGDALRHAPRNPSADPAIVALPEAPASWAETLRQAAAGRAAAS